MPPTQELRRREVPRPQAGAGGVCLRAVQEAQPPSIRRATDATNQSTTLRYPSRNYARAVAARTASSGDGSCARMTLVVPWLVFPLLLAALRPAAGADHRCAAHAGAPARHGDRRRDTHRQRRCDGSPRPSSRDWPQWGSSSRDPLASPDDRSARRSRRTRVTARPSSHPAPRRSPATSSSTTPRPSSR